MPADAIIFKQASKAELRFFVKRFFVNFSEKSKIAVFIDTGGLCL